MYQRTVKATLLASAFILTAAGSASAADEDHISFKMVAANPCLPDAKAKVQIISDGEAEDMFIVATGPQDRFRLLRDPGAQNTIWAVLVSRGYAIGRRRRCCPAL